MKLKEDKNLRKRDSERENKWLSIKMKKQDSEQKVDKKATNKVEEGPKTMAKRGKKGRKTRAC